MEDRTYQWWNNLELEGKSGFNENETTRYHTLVSLLLGSLHIHHAEQTFNSSHLFELGPESKRVRETSKRLGK